MGPFVFVGRECGLTANIAELPTWPNSGQVELKFEAPGELVRIGTRP